MGEESRHALIIANDSYEDPGLKKLRAPAQDAVALAEVLGDPQIGGFDVRVMRNEPAHVISMRVDDFFSDRRPGDTLVLHFSCHGLKSETGELFFAAPNTLPRRLASTAVAANFVRRCMASTRARSIALLLDCCYGGAFSQGPASVRAGGDAHVLDSFAGDKLGGGRGWAVITASNSMEYAFEGTDLAEGSVPQPSVFTRAVVQGLATGEADLDEDGRVSLDELYEYVFDHVRRQNPHQTPGRTVDMQGDLYLARSHRRRIVPSPVPDDVRAAMRSPDIYTRRGALTELRARMENRDLSVAVGAREALEEMAHRDIHAVAEEASRALSEMGINPHPTRLDFGPVRQHTSPPHRTVHLLGPPLARSCTPHVKGPRLRAQESGDGLDVWVDTVSTGSVRGDIVLKGAVGEAVVHVEGKVVPAEEAASSPQGRTASPSPASPSAHATSPAAGPKSRPAKPEPPPSVTAPASQRAGSPAPPSTHRTPPSPEARRPASRETTGATARPRVPPPPFSPRPRRYGADEQPTRPNTAPSSPPENGAPASPDAHARRTPTSPRSLRAPTLAAAGLALAALAGDKVIEAGVRVSEIARSAENTGTTVKGLVEQTDLLTPLVICLLSAVTGLVLTALARHEAKVRPERCTPSATVTTRLLTATAKWLAVPTLILAALMLIAYLVVQAW
ncbi:caspase family protein [Streptomyces sp. NPDC085927]|uniref:caspase family protein n=1 Tax=Streptomyces sp. NPDC085927 TaxID=3365738 RepID=UPI0037CF61FE